MLFLEQADNKLLSFSATFNPSDGLVYSHENDKRLSLQPKGSLMRYQIFMPSIIACIGGTNIPISALKHLNNLPIAYISTLALKLQI